MRVTRGIHTRNKLIMHDLCTCLRWFIFLSFFRPVSIRHEGHERAPQDDNPVFRRSHMLETFPFYWNAAGGRLTDQLPLRNALALRAYTVDSYR